MTSIHHTPQESAPDSRRPFGLHGLNVALLAAGVAVIALGYVLLAEGSTTAAPLMLMLGYAGLIPAGLLWGLRKTDDTRPTEGE